MSPINFGIVLFLVGLGIFLLTLILLRVIPHQEPRPSAVEMPALPMEIAWHSQAVLLVQAGGRITYYNQAARKLLGLNREPNLELLGRRARPSEAFLGLCAAEGQARFLLDDHIIQGVSYAIPYGNSRAVLVTLQRPQLFSARSEDGDGQDISFQTAQGWGILAEVSQAMTSSLDLENTLRAVIESLEHLIPSDRCEINLWDPENRYLIPYQLAGGSETERRLERSSQRSASDLGYTGYLVAHRHPLLIADVETYQQVRFSGERERFPFHSFLGIALEAGSELIGTLELASFGKDSFTDSDQELLRMLSQQAAYAIHNAQSYEVEEKRARELSGLARLAQAVAAQREPQDLYVRLVESIAPSWRLKSLVFGCWMKSSGS